MPFAHFVRYPRTIDELEQPHRAEEECSYVIVQTISLKKIDFDNFAADMLVYRDFLDGLEPQCFPGETYGCILVCTPGSENGILVAEASEGRVYSAALIRMKKTLHDKKSPSGRNTRGGRDPQNLIRWAM